MEKQITDTTWYILGAGAIGCLWASYWRLSGIDTVLITPSKRNSSSIKLTTLKETHTLEIKSLTIEELLNSSVNIHYLLVTTKAQKTIAALNTLRSHIDKIGRAHV